MATTSVLLWDCFEKIQGANCNTVGVCQVNNCGKKIQAAGGSTSGLHNRLIRIHNINLLKRKTDSSDGTTKVSLPTKAHGRHGHNVITNFFKKEVDDSLPAVLSRLIAKDGLSFNVICISQDLRKLLEGRSNIPIPKFHNTIRKIVMEYAEKIKVETVESILAYKEKDLKLSLTLDEWSSTKNCRYMNVNVHGQRRFWNLGLARTHGSMPADKCLEILANKLATFKLHLEDFIASTTDGASVMKKFGRLSEIGHQLCFAHGIHLAVINVLYKKNFESSIGSTDVADVTDLVNQDDFPNDDADDESDETENVEDNFNITLEELVSIPELTFNIKGLVDKVRKIVKMFRKSPTKTDIFQKNVVSQFGKEKSLIIDSRTRWNSLLDMLARFYELRDCVRKSLTDIQHDVIISQDDINCLHDIVFALDPVKVTVEALCREDATLLTADVALKFMVDELGSQDNAISRALKNTLSERITERRNIFSDILSFLHDSESYTENSNSEIFNKLSKTILTKHIIELAERLFQNEKHFLDPAREISEDLEAADTNLEEVVIIEELPAAENSEKTNTNFTMKEKLDLMIKERVTIKTSGTTKQPCQLSTFKGMIRAELKLFIEQKNRGKYLEALYQSLLTIPPTSVESERAFSAAGLFCTKIRSRLADNALDSLCFLRAYFLN